MPLFDMEVDMTKIKTSASKNKIELWDPWDKRLPEAVVREAPSLAFIEGMAEDQWSAIGVGHNREEGWFLMYGRKRLLAKRAIAADPEKYTIEQSAIKVEIFEGITKAEALKATVIENAHRSNNEVTTWQAIKEKMKEKDFASYEKVAEFFGLTIGQVKSYENKWHKVPDWAVQGVVDGGMSVSTARMIGHSPMSVQKELKKSYKKDEGLTMAQVQETKHVTMKDFMPAAMIKEPPRFVPMAEINKLLWVVENRPKKDVIDFIHSLQKGESNAENN